MPKKNLNLDKMYLQPISSSIIGVSPTGTAMPIGTPLILMLFFFLFQILATNTYESHNHDASIHCTLPQIFLNHSSSTFCNLDFIRLQ